MQNRTKDVLQLPRCCGRQVEAEFSDSVVSSDGGVLTLNLIDRQLNLTEALDGCLPDPRDPRLTTHSQLSLLRQRIYGLALGYEDLNDHQTLREDPALQTAVGRDEVLASPSTLCRLENRVDREAVVRFHQVLVEQFIASFDKPPKQLILDFDATNDEVHGEQEGRFFHGYYDQYCFLPLYVFCGTQLLVSYLRPSDKDGAKHAWAILSLLVKRLRQVWPKVRIIFRGDSGFCRPRILSWCDRHDVGYVIGLAKNARLLARTTKHTDELMEQAYRIVGTKVRYIGEINYGAKSWDRERRVVVRLEYGEQGSDVRFVVTNLDSPAQALYEHDYCQRGEMENRIKEKKCDLKADRTSCHRWWANQFRLMLTSCAYVLIDALRRQALSDTELACARVDTIRLKLLKIGTVMIRNTRRVRFLFSRHYPHQALFSQVVAKLVPG